MNKEDLLIYVLIGISMFILILSSLIGTYVYFTQRSPCIAPIVGAMAPPPAPVTSMVPSATNVLPHDGKQYPLKDFNDTITITFGGPGTIFDANGAWSLTIWGPLGPSQEAIFMINIRTGSVGNELVFNNTIGSSGNWTPETVMKLPASWSYKNQNIFTAKLRSDGSWDMYLNGVILGPPMPYKSTSHQTPAWASYSAWNNSGQWIDPPTALVHFS